MSTTPDVVEIEVRAAGHTLTMQAHRTAPDTYEFPAIALPFDVATTGPISVDGVRVAKVERVPHVLDNGGDVIRLSGVHPDPMPVPGSDPLPTPSDPLR